MSNEDPRIAIIQQKLAEAKIHPAERDAVSYGRSPHAYTNQLLNRLLWWSKHYRLYHTWRVLHEESRRTRYGRRRLGTKN